jgi:hypothetical protein
LVTLASSGGFVECLIGCTFGIGWRWGDVSEGESVSLRYTVGDNRHRYGNTIITITIIISIIISISCSNIIMSYVIIIIIIISNIIYVIVSSSASSCISGNISINSIGQLIGVRYIIISVNNVCICICICI